MAPISRKTTLTQSVLTPISSKRTVAHCVLHEFLRFNNTGKLEAKTTVAQCDLEPVSNNSTVAHAFLHKFYLKSKWKFLGYY